MSDRAKDNAELCDLLLGEYQKAKPKLSKEQKRNKYFSVVLYNIPSKYKTYAKAEDMGYEVICHTFDYPVLRDEYEKFLKSIGIDTTTYSVKVLGNKVHYLNVYYGDFKFKDCIG